MPRAVVVGVGQLRHRSSGTEDAREPLDLMEEAARAALSDAGPAGALLRALDRVVVVRTDSWRYDPDVADRLAGRLGAEHAAGSVTKHGGNQPVLQLDLAARQIARGDARAVLVCGGESYASRRHFSRAGQTPPWTPSAAGPRESGLEVTRRALGKEGAAPPPRQLGEAERHGLFAPIRMYPLYENAYRAALGLGFAENQEWSGRIYEAFTQVAASHPAAWNPEPRTAEEIATVSARNRMICFPYPLLMNAFQGVDQAAAVLVVADDLARELGLDGAVHVWAGAGASDTADVVARVGFDRAPAMEATLRDVLALPGLAIDDVDHLDLYSCFPVVPKMSSRALGVAGDRSLTVTGGLTSFGGPGNAYSLHALATMTSVLREDTGSVGLVYGQGHYVTEHHAVVLADAPPPTDVLPAADDTARQAAVAALPAPPVATTPRGRGTVETFTVEFGREGEPSRGWVVGRTGDGERFVAASADPAVLTWLVDEQGERVGAAVGVDQAADGTNAVHLA